MNDYSIRIPVGGKPVIGRISLSLESIQGVVGGHVECLRLSDSVDLWINEEGRRLCRFNRIIVRPADGAMFDIYGQMLIARRTFDGDTVGLSHLEAIEWLRVAESWVVSPVSQTHN